MAPAQAPSSLDCNPSEYCNFEVGYFLEAHLITLKESQQKKISANQQIQVFGKTNIPALHNQEFIQSFKLKGLVSFFKQNAFVVCTKLVTNQVNPGTSLPIEMEIDNSKCSEAVSAIRVGLARTVNVPKNIIRKKFKMESEEIVFASSGSMPAN